MGQYVSSYIYIYNIFRLIDIIHFCFVFVLAYFISLLKLIQSKFDLIKPHAYSYSQHCSFMLRYSITLKRSFMMLYESYHSCTNLCPI